MSTFLAGIDAWANSHPLATIAMAVAAFTGLCLVPVLREVLRNRRDRLSDRWAAQRERELRGRIR